MARVLELTELAQDDGVAEREVRAAGIDAQLHPERTAEPKLLLEASGGKQVDRVAGEIFLHCRARLPRHWRSSGEHAPRSGGASASSDCSPS